MSIIIATKNGEKLFKNNQVVTVGSQENCDVIISVPVNFVLSVEMSS